MSGGGGALPTGSGAAGSPAAAGSSGGAASHRVRTGADAATALGAVAAAAEDWGGSWQPQGRGAGVLRLPVQAGLRRGQLDVNVAANALPGGGVELAFAVERAAWVVHRTAAGLLAIAAAGALATVLWPFVPALVPLAPMGLVLAVGAWLVVLSRLRNQGLDELTEDVDARLQPTTGADAAGD